MNSISTTCNFSVLPSAAELQSYKVIAEVAADNPYWRKLGGSGTPQSIIATIFSVMLMARELGISPMQAVSGGINNIQGKFEISARLMNQIIRRHGHQLRIIHSDDQICRIWGKRKDTGEEYTEVFTFEEAVRAGLVKDASGWKKWPKDMLFARCISRLARRLWADLIGGCYVEGELSETLVAPFSSAPEMPDPKEIEIASQQEIVLSLPEGIDANKVEKYLEECAQTVNCTVQYLKKNATERMESFLQKFQEWESKQNVSLEVAV